MEATNIQGLLLEKQSSSMLKDTYVVLQLVLQQHCIYK
jgi:hypothetical protein